MTLRHLGIVGFGSIGRALLATLAAEIEEPLERVDLLVRPRQTDEATRALAPLQGRLAAETACHVAAEALLAARPEFLVECAGHAAVRALVLPALDQGIECVVASVGALADPELHAALLAAARKGRTRLVIAPGAIGGIDLLSALRSGGIERVDYTGRKPPAAWQGTPAEQAVALDALTAPAVFFEGDARSAARHYPKNANVAATLALAGAGFERTRVRLVADPGVTHNVHEIAVTGCAARFELRVEGLPSPANPRTSLATVHSLAREVLNRARPLAI